LRGLDGTYKQLVMVSLERVKWRLCTFSDGRPKGVEMVQATNQVMFLVRRLKVSPFKSSPNELRQQHTENSKTARRSSKDLLQMTNQRLQNACHYSLASFTCRFHRLHPFPAQCPMLRHRSLTSFTSEQRSWRSTPGRGFVNVHVYLQTPGLQFRRSHL
jgi:hypothetical protein